MRAQVSMEYMILMGFTLLLIGPLLFLYSQHNADMQDSFSLAQATRAADTIASAAERVYFAGPPSQEQILITIPEGVSSFNIAESSIDVVLTSGQQATAYTQAQLIPTTIRPAQGRQYVLIQATPGGIQITES